SDPSPSTCSPQRFLVKSSISCGLSRAKPDEHPVKNRRVLRVTGWLRIRRSHVRAVLDAPFQFLHIALLLVLLTEPDFWSVSEYVARAEWAQAANHRCAELWCS